MSAPRGIPQGDPVTLNLSPELIDTLRKWAERLPATSRVEDLGRELYAKVFGGLPEAQRRKFEEMVVRRDRLTLTFDTEELWELPWELLYAAGSTSAAAATSPLPVWASPQAMAVAAWLTALLTLIAVILAVATLAQAHGPPPAPVQIVIVSPGNKGP